MNVDNNSWRDEVRHGGKARAVCSHRGKWRKLDCNRSQERLREHLVAKMMKASENIGVEWMMNLSNTIVAEGRIPTDWKTRTLIPVFKGIDQLECGSFRVVKLLDHDMKWRRDRGNI